MKTVVCMTSISILKSQILKENPKRMSFTDVLFFCDYLIQFQARYFLMACNQSLNNSVYQNDAEGSVF